MVGSEGDEPLVEDTAARTSPVPAEHTVPAWADRSRWPWYLLSLAVLLLILVSCQLNRTAESEGRPAATVTVTVTAPGATPVRSGPADPTTSTRAARPTTRANGSDYRRPAKPAEDQLFYRSTFTSCATLNIVYRHGVGTDGAVDQVTDGQTEVDDWSRDPSSYWVNESLDDDGDGVACERGDR